MGEGFVVDGSYQGYVFLNWAAGQFETEKKEKRPYYNMFVLSPVSDYSSEDYKAFGYKAEKKKCISADVWEGLNPGDQVRLFFDDKSRVVSAALDGVVPDDAVSDDTASDRDILGPPVSRVNLPF